MLAADLTLPGPELATPRPTRVICVGARFTRPTPAEGDGFPQIVLRQTDTFAFRFAPETGDALRLAREDGGAGLVLLDSDGEPLGDLLDLVAGLRAARPQLPIVAVSRRADERMRRLMRAGVDWHFTRTSPALRDLWRALTRYVPAFADAAGREASQLHNPYVVGRPLTGAAASLYVGRDDLFDWARRNLDAAEPNPLLLYGRRRVGKTSTLYQLVEGERGRPLRAGGRRPVYPLFLDLQRLAGSGTEEWLRRLAGDVQRHAQAIAGPAWVEPAEDESGFAYLDRVLDGLEATVPGDGLLLLALDEVDDIRGGVASGRLAADIVPFLRAQIQQRRRIAFLLCGSAGLLDPFWETVRTLAARHELGNLRRDELETLVRQPVSGIWRYPDAVIDRIWELTAGQPYQTQVICHRLVARLLDDAPPDGVVRPADLEQVVAELDDAPEWNGGPKSRRAEDYRS